mmetsp:Transcript_29463/g.47564  ORF Transcript_29463/g.47564 Transcript_29463/m.47564 type:complete len:113 (+) Transcript_29463:260-598(+)
MCVMVRTRFTELIKSCGHNARNNTFPSLIPRDIARKELMAKTKPSSNAIPSRMGGQQRRNLNTQKPHTEVAKITVTIIAWSGCIFSMVVKVNRRLQRSMPVSHFPTLSLTAD